MEATQLCFQINSTNIHYVSSIMLGVGENTRNNAIMDFTGMAFAEGIITSVMLHKNQMDKKCMKISGGEKMKPTVELGVGQVQMARTGGGSETGVGVLHKLHANFKVLLPK